MVNVCGYVRYRSADYFTDSGAIVFEETLVFGEKGLDKLRDEAGGVRSAGWRLVVGVSVGDKEVVFGGVFGHGGVCEKDARVGEGVKWLSG
jgi:hypothetical protein